VRGDTSFWNVGDDSSSPSTTFAFIVTHRTTCYQHQPTIFSFRPSVWLVQRRRKISIDKLRPGNPKSASLSIEFTDVTTGESFGVSLDHPHRFISRAASLEVSWVGRTPICLDGRLQL